MTRSFFYWPDFHPAPDTIDDASVERFRQFLTASDDLGIQTIPTFIVGHMSGANWDPAWRNGRNYYTDGFMLGQQAFFIREMVRRIAPSPAIAAWLISNEMPLLGGPVDHEYGRAWGLICTDAVRAGGSDLPVSLGDGVWTKEITGRDNGFRLRDQLDVVDFFGPHSYPMGTDPTRQLARAAFICEAAHFGKPIVRRGVRHDRHLRRTRSRRALLPAHAAPEPAGRRDRLAGLEQHRLHPRRGRAVLQSPRTS